MSSIWRRIRGFAILAVGMAAMSGCVSVPQIDPPNLQLQAYGPPSPKLTNMRIENGAGEAIYDGKHFNNPLTYDPMDPRFDGTLKIIRTYSDGTVREQTFTHTVGAPVHLDFDWVKREYALKEKPKTTAPQFYGGLNPAFQILNRPDTPLVRQEQGGMVTGFVNGDNDTNNPQFNGRVGFKIDQPLFGLGKKWGFELRGSYFTSDAELERDIVPANGGNLAVFGPIGGGGFVTGNDIRNLDYSSDYTAWNIQPRFNKSYTVGSLYGRDLRMNSYLGFNYGKNEDDQSLSGTVNGVGDFSTMNWIDNWYYGPEGGFYAAWDWCPKVKLTAGGFVNFNVNDLKAKRMLISTFGQEGQDEFSDTEFTVGGGVNVGAHYKIAPGVSAGAGFQWERQSNTPVVDINQDTGVADVDAEGSDAYQFMLGFRVNY